MAVPATYTGTGHFESLRRRYILLYTIAVRNRLVNIRDEWEDRQIAAEDWEHMWTT